MKKRILNFKFSIFALLFFSIFLFAKSADAATYYVSVGGHGETLVSDNNSCEQAKNINMPKQTITDAKDCLAPGDTLIARGGTYIEQIIWNSPSGTASSPITVRPQAGESVTLAVPDARSVAIEFGYGANHIVTDGFTLDGRNLSGNVLSFWRGANNITFTNGEIKNSLYSAVIMANSILPGEENNPDMQLTQFNTVSRTTIHDSSGTGGIYLGYQASDNIIEQNTFYNLNMAITMGDEGGGLYPVIGHRVRRNIIRNNIMRNNGREYHGAAVHLSGAHDTLIYNNLMYNSRGGEFYGSAIAHENGSDNTKIYNNTIYNNGDYGIYMRGGAATAKNNIIYGNTAGTWLVTAGTLDQSNNLTINPLFVNTPAGNFHLQSTSPAINAGAALGAPYNVDMDGVIRPQGAGWDIGAYEYGSIAPTPTPPSITVTPSSTTVSSPISVTISNAPGFTTDWVGIFTPTATGDQYSDWKYLNNTQIAPITALTNATITFTAPSIAGTYEIRLYQNNSISEVDKKASATFTVTPAPVPPTVTISANPSTITSGQSSTLSWSSTNATSCTASGGWTGAKSISGTQSVFPTITSIYTLSCTGTGGSASGSATVIVTTPPSTKFAIGDRVQVTAGPLNVRSTPSTTGTLLGTQNTGALGTVIGGPTNANGFNWWNINYDTGADGWSVEDFLTKFTPTLAGDLNNDRIVNSLDWSIMNGKWLTNDPIADLNKDGIVNTLDWSIMSGNWLKTI